MKYLHIQGRNIKVPILSSEIEYKINFGRYSITFDKFYEALCIYSYFSYNAQCSLQELIRYNYKDVCAEEIDVFVSTFSKTHGMLPIKYDIKNISTLASPGEVIFMASDMFAGPVSFSYAQEINLLKIIKQPDDEFKYRFMEWWRNYCENYAIHAKCKRDLGLEAEELAGMFCNIHGFDLNWLQQWYSGNLYKILPKKEYVRFLRRKFVFWAKFWLCVALYMCFAVFVILTGQDIDNFILSGITMTIGILMIFAPISWLLNGGKK